MPIREGALEDEIVSARGAISRETRHSAPPAKFQRHIQTMCWEKNINCWPTKAPERGASHPSGVGFQAVFAF